MVLDKRYTLFIICIGKDLEKFRKIGKNYKTSLGPMYMSVLLYFHLPRILYGGTLSGGPTEMSLYRHMISIVSMASFNYANKT